MLQGGDPLGTSPTGLVLDFSGSIDVNSLNATENNQSAIWVVDQSGHTWFLTPTSYDASLAQLSFVFDQPLPPGQYTLFNSSSDGLKDLAGWAPVAPGLPQGVLATWTIPPSTPPVVPGNLGVVWPSQQDGVADSELILPGQVATSQVFVPMQGLYTLQTSVSQGTLAIERRRDRTDWSSSIQGPRALRTSTRSISNRASTSSPSEISERRRLWPTGRSFPPTSITST